ASSQPSWLLQDFPDHLFRLSALPSSPNRWRCASSSIWPMSAATKQILEPEPADVGAFSASTPTERSRRQQVHGSSSYPTSPLGFSKPTVLPSTVMITQTSTPTDYRRRMFFTS